MDKNSPEVRFNCTGLSCTDPLWCIQHGMCKDTHDVTGYSRNWYKRQYEAQRNENARLNAKLKLVASILREHYEPEEPNDA